ncbi:MAG: UbiA family prenyltransferase [Porphyrobacter sp.]|nr:UbiA family prenyltransferase [Porphyrobacter sp.]
MIASSVYVLNDLLDLRADRAHPRKRKGPFASGAIPLVHGMAMAPLLLAAGFALALVIGRWDFLAVLGIYYIVTLSYSLVLKRKLIIDVCTLAALYTLRIVAGGEATGTVLSEWLLAFSMFLFLSLAATGFVRTRMTQEIDLPGPVTAEPQEAAKRIYRA